MNEFGKVIVPRIHDLRQRGRDKAGIVLVAIHDRVTFAIHIHIKHPVAKRTKKHVAFRHSFHYSHEVFLLKLFIFLL